MQIVSTRRKLTKAILTSLNLEGEAQGECYNLNYVCVFSMDSRNLTSVSSVHSVHDILYTVYKSVHCCYIYQLKIL